MAKKTPQNILIIVFCIGLFIGSISTYFFLPKSSTNSISVETNELDQVETTTSTTRYIEMYVRPSPISSSVKIIHLSEVAFLQIPAEWYHESKDNKGTDSLPTTMFTNMILY